MKSESIKAVYDAELIKILKELNLLQKIKSNEVKCKFCGDIISVDTIQFIIPENDRIAIVCNKEACMSNFLSKKDD